MNFEYQLPARLSAATSPAKQVDTEALQRLLPPFRVVLHNDDHNSMDHVVESLVACVPSLTLEDAATIMLRAHNDGSTTVITCPKEAAEHYRDCLESKGLTSTIEAA